MRSWILLAVVLMSPGLAPAEWSGNVAVQARGFTEAAVLSEQENAFWSLSAEPEWYWVSESDVAWTVTPFLRLEAVDEDRSHADLRELNAFWSSGDWEWRVGVSREFWGVAESQHLVDVINQTDNLEGIDGEDKLGQPMIHAARYVGDGVLNFYILPGFREREFPGEEGRLRPSLPVDTQLTQYESSAEDAQVDVALRWVTYVDIWESGLSWFYGTNREPELLLDTSSAQPVLFPRYNLMQQIGWDLQATTEEVIWKLEVIKRRGDPQDFVAATAGLEYTTVGVMNSDADLGWLFEYSADDQGSASSRLLQNDVFLGTRLAMNDKDSTELLAGVFHDLDYGSNSLRIEGSRRYGQHWTASLEMQLFAADDAADPMSAFDQDDFIQLELARYF